MKRASLPTIAFVRVLLIGGHCSYSGLEKWKDDALVATVNGDLRAGPRSQVQVPPSVVREPDGPSKRPGLVERSCLLASGRSVLTAWGRGKGAVREPGRAAGVRGSAASLLFTVEV